MQREVKGSIDMSECLIWNCRRMDIAASELASYVV